FPAQHARRRLNLTQHTVTYWTSWINQYCDDSGLGDKFVQQFQTLRIQCVGDEAHASNIAARPVQDCAPGRGVIGRLRQGWPDNHNAAILATSMVRSSQTCATVSRLM